MYTMLLLDSGVSFWIEVEDEVGETWKRQYIGAEKMARIKYHVTGKLSLRISCGSAAGSSP